MLLSGEFDSPAVQLQKDIIPLNIEEAKWRIERSAYLSFGPAQYKMGFSYEYATLACPFDPLLSVQYYALASQNGEVEADMGEHRHTLLERRWTDACPLQLYRSGICAALKATLTRMSSWL